MVERLAQILNFLETTDSLKSVERAAYLSDQSRHETDSDHTWHMAMFAMLLYKELSFKVDINRVISLVLVHDLCEIYAGDTFAHSQDYKNHESEQEAVEKLFALLPADQHDLLLDSWNEFAFGASPEARYARALDRLQALAQNVFSAGRTWREHQVSETMSRDLNREAMDLDPVMKELFESLYQRATAEGLWPN